MQQILLMPFITIHTTNKEQTAALTPVINNMRHIIAKVLSCGDRALALDEVSIRILESAYAESIAQIEVLVTAFSYTERINNQDHICLEIKNYLQQNFPEYSFFVWLQLSELGHSVDESS